MNGKSRVEVVPGFVELQLLRHGPPHNQLLSPLTEYLALCGDHSNTTLRIPLEHSALETRLRALRYIDSEQTRIDQLREIARIASDLLAKVPGLIADLSSDRAGGKPFVHLSIASRASELALFPFELAVSPDGFPGAGQPLCMQKQLPICLTRRSKNVRNDDFDWDRPIKILLVASDAGGEIPLRQHYSLLRKLVEPWVGTMPSDDMETKKHKSRRVLRLLANADIDQIERTLCDEASDYGEPFTHIHVLAHGCDLPDSNRRSGIAFHDVTRSDRIDAVDGRRLAEALGCLPDYPSTSKRFRGPTVVTLATCGSADQGSVMVPGASVAFELHDSGIPLVVGSQFPLTADGSVIMTESLYRGFLAGRDPRSTIWETRRALQSNSSQSPAPGDQAERAAHDWASLTVYAALPRTLDDVMPTHRRNRQKRRMDVRLRNMYRVLEVMPELDNPSRASSQNDTRQQQMWENVPGTLLGADKAVRKFDKWVRHNDSNDVAARVINYGILASAQKQLGLLYLRASARPDQIGTVDEDEKKRDICDREGKHFLQTSRQTYWQIFEMCRNEGWALVQFVALNFALRGDYAENDWTVANQLGLLEQHVPNAQRRVWALAGLLELQFLAWLKADLNERKVEKTDHPYDLAKRICDLFNEAPWDVFSAKRQFDRYIDGFAQLARLCELEPGAGRHHRQSFRDSMRSPSKLATVGPDAVAANAIRDVLRVFNELDFSALLRQDEFIGT